MNHEVNGVSMWPQLERILFNVARSPEIDAGLFDAAMAKIFDSACLGLHVQRVSIWFLDEGEQVLQCRFLLRHEEGRRLEVGSELLNESDCPAYFKAIKKERILRISKVADDPRTCELVSHYSAMHQTCALLDVPIRHHGKMIGVLCCEHQHSARDWHNEEAAFAAALADLVGRCINAQAYSRTQRQLQALTEQLELRVAQGTRCLEETNQSLAATQHELMESVKMASLGQLVAGVAHEVNTPLGISITACSHISDEMDALFAAYKQGSLTSGRFNEFVQNCRDGLQLLEKNLSRAAELIRDFKQTAVEQTNDRLSTFNVKHTVEGVFHSLMPETKKQGIRVELDIADDILMTGYAGAIAQIITNLVMNSKLHGFELMPHGEGSIQLAAHPQGEFVCLEYRDNGQGIEESSVARIFEPFYTTKRGNGGSGLGLSIIHNLITQKLGGDIQCASKIGEGVVFSIRLPREWRESNLLDVAPAGCHEC